MGCTVIVPSYEPDERMVHTVEGLLEEGFTDVIVVNDGSSSECEKYFYYVSELPNVTLINHETNKGKGCAIKTGISYVLTSGKKVDGVVTVDADGQHTPKDIKKCVNELNDDKESVILGVREFNNKSVPIRSKFGNGLTSLVFRFCGIKISDTQTGLRVIPYKHLQLMTEISGDRYEYETQQLLEISKKNIPIKEVAIETIYLDENESSHFNPIKDSIKIYGVIFRSLFGKHGIGFEAFKYTISSFCSFLVDITLFSLISIILDCTNMDDALRILAATASARTISSIFNYFMNKKFVFCENESNKASMIKYFIMAVIQACLSYGGVYFITNILFSISAGPLETFIKIVIDSCLFCISFIVQKIWVFK